MRCYTTKAANGPQKDLARLCPYATHFEYSGVDQASPVRNDFQQVDKPADGLTIEEPNKRKSERNKERKELFTPDDKAEDKAKNADYQRRVGLPVKKFKKQANKANMFKAAIDAVVRDFQKLARLAKKNSKLLPLAEDHPQDHEEE